MTSLTARTASSSSSARHPFSSCPSPSQCPQLLL
jgi:hypothetical protein